MSEALLELRDVSVRRGAERVLEGVTLSVRAGTIHALVGPNGGGKSTLLQLVLGAIDFTGEAVLNLRGSGRIGFVPQRFAGEQRLPLTVAELLALQRQRWPVCLGIRRSTRARISSVLERVGLAGFERRQMGELSGGEAQRVLLANALDPEPELLLLDEPTTGLDAQGFARLEETLVSERRRGAAVVLVSHDAAQVERLADEVTRISRTAERLKVASP